MISKFGYLLSKWSKNLSKIPNFVKDHCDSEKFSRGLKMNDVEKALHIAKKAHELLVNKKYDQLKQYLINQYPTKGEVNLTKVDIAIEILINILEE